MKNKKIMGILAAVIMVLGTACSRQAKEPAPIPVENSQEQAGESGQQEVSDPASVSENAGEEGGEPAGNTDAAEEKTVQGTLETIKNVMFTLKAEDGEAYVFPIEEDDTEFMNGFEIGDKVVITYTGTLEVGSEDLFAVKVEKAE